MSLSAPFTLADLARIVADRAATPRPSSPTRQSSSRRGRPHAAKKLGEEAVEAAIAAVQGDRAGLVAEAADVLYHLLVVLEGAHVALDEVMNELQRRTAQCGLAEKASRRVMSAAQQAARAAEPGVDVPDARPVALPRLLARGMGEAARRYAA